MAQPQATSGQKPLEQAKATASAVGNAVTATGKGTLKGFDRAWHFIDGTINGALNGCAKFGRMGLWAGVALGVASMLIPGGVLIAGFQFAGLTLPFYGALAGAVAGSALGLVQGALTGGAERVALEGRKEKYAKELDERRSVRTTSPARRLNRAYDRARDNIARADYDKLDQYNDRIGQQNQGSWAERVDASRSGGSLER